MDKKNYSLKEIRASLTEEKRRADGFWTRFVLRPLSYPAAWLALRLGLSANAVSYLSALAALVGGVLLATGSKALMITGALLLNLFAVLDCADGNIARVKGTAGPWGGWADALGGYAAYLAALLGSGMASEFLAGNSIPGLPGLSLPWAAGGWALLGGLAAGANQLMRLAYQGYRNVLGEAAREEIAGEKKLSENLGVTGILMPAILIGVLTGCLPWVTAFYAALYTGGCAVTLVKLVMKVEKF